MVKLDLGHEKEPFGMLPLYLTNVTVAYFVLQKHNVNVTVPQYQEGLLRK